MTMKPSILHPSELVKRIRVHSDADAFEVQKLEFQLAEARSLVKVHEAFDIACSAPSSIEATPSEAARANCIYPRCKEPVSATRRRRKVMAQFTHALCEEVIRTEGRCGLTRNEITQMARLALRTLKADAGPLRALLELW